MAGKSKIDKRLERLGIFDVELCDGIIVHSKLRLGTTRELERILKVPSYAWSSLDLGTIDIAIHFIYHLAYQRYESKPHEYDEPVTQKYIEEKLEDAEVEGVVDFAEMFKKLVEIISGKYGKNDDDENGKGDATGDNELKKPEAGTNKTTDIQEVTEKNPNQ
jgi:hypothetical protein